jgi:hypothetical protein
MGVNFRIVGKPSFTRLGELPIIRTSERRSAIAMLQSTPGSKRLQRTGPGTYVVVAPVTSGSFSASAVTRARETSTAAVISAVTFTVVKKVAIKRPILAAGIPMVTTSGEITSKHPCGTPGTLKVVRIAVSAMITSCVGASCTP